MKKTILLLLFFSFLFFFSEFKLLAQNIFANPGFENGLNGWVPFSTNANFSSQTVVSTNPNSGTSCLELKINSSTVITSGALQSFPVEPMQHFLFEFNIKTDSLIGSALAYFNFVDTAVNFEYGIMQVTGTSPWQHFKSKFTVPAGNTNSLTIFLFFKGTSGSAYFDDIVLTQLTDTTSINFSVNLFGNEGQIKNYLGTNVGPITLNGTFDFTDNFKQSGINYVRTHDYYKACDISTIFPDTSKSASDASAYNFTSSDSVIKAAINANCKILYRLGESFEANPTHNSPPADMNKWAEICLNVVKHYNNGWNNGFYFNIKEWEIWNEPDGAMFWNGTVNDFVKLYRLTSKKLKQFDNTLLVGGPAIGSVLSNDFLNVFLDSISTKNLPMDFFSYHYYNIANPYYFKYIDSLVVKKLSEYNLSSVKRYITEWNTLTFSGNINQAGVWHNSPYISSQAASTIAYWQKNGPDKAFWYRTDEYLFGLFDETTGKYTFTGRVFDAVNKLNETPTLLPSTGNDNLGRSILAGKTTYGDSINIILSDFASASDGYKMAINGISNADQYLYKQYRVLNTDSLSLLGTGIISANNPFINAKSNCPFTDLIILTKLPINGYIENKKINNSISVFPNPSSEQIIISLPLSQIKAESLQIFNSNGILIKELRIVNFLELSIINFPKGIYYIKTELFGGAKFVKI